MKTAWIAIILLASAGCTDKRKEADRKQRAYADSARADSIEGVNLKRKNNETDSILWNNQRYTFDEFDSIFTGKKRYNLQVPASADKLPAGTGKR